MKKLEIETQREHKIQGLSSNNFLEIEDPRDLVVSGEQTNLTLQKQTDSKITLYMTEPQTIIIQQRNDTTQTVYV
tara:strand:+ start:317 stop:541 length:225 start_codon:yes stop_codon:yes gene_type:complete